MSFLDFLFSLNQTEYIENRYHVKYQIDVLCLESYQRLVEGWKTTTPDKVELSWECAF